MIFFKEIVQNWRMDINAYKIRILIEQDIYKHIIDEIIIDAHTFSSEYEDFVRISLS